MLSKKDAKARAQQIKDAMNHLLTGRVVVTLGPHEFILDGIADVHIPALNTLAMVPDKIDLPETGKQATPQVLQILFTTGERINIVLDDIDEFTIGLTGAVFKIGDEVLRVRHES